MRFLKTISVILDILILVLELSAHVSTPTVSEGTQVTLTCKTSCKLTSIVWFKNGQQVSNPVFQAKREDSGSYRCAIEGQETWKSEAVMLNVQYGPKDVVLLISPPGDVVIGSSVTLTCNSSGSYPSIQSYTILKDNTEETQEKTLTISNIQLSHSGTYSCQAKNNFTTVNSTEVTLHVLSNNVALISGVGVSVLVLLILSFIIVSWVRKKKTLNAEKEHEQDVDYCSVTFKPETKTQADHNSTALESTLSGETGNEDISVIYSSVKEDTSAIYATVM